MSDVTVLVKIRVPYQVKRMLVRSTVMFSVSIVQCNVLLVLTVTSCQILSWSLLSVMMQMELLWRKTNFILVSENKTNKT